MTDSQEYRNRAEACTRMAESSANPLDGKTFSQLAAIWLRLANELDTTRALIEHWGVIDRPTPRSGISSDLRVLSTNQSVAPSGHA